MTAEEKTTLLCYSRYIEKILNPDYILSYMKAWLTEGEFRLGLLGADWQGRLVGKMQSAALQPDWQAMLLPRFQTD